MSHRSPSGAVEVLEAYFRAKDGNRPHLAERVFAPDARLEVVNRTSAISFPAVTEGGPAIVDVLVRQFGRSYENVRSFYLSRPRADATRFSCAWLVGMTARETGEARVGCGRYDWILRPAPWRATQLVITIDAMEVLPAGSASSILAWLASLAYPWSTARAVVNGAPKVEGLAPVLALLCEGTRTRRVVSGRRAFVIARSVDGLTSPRNEAPMPATNRGGWKTCRRGHKYRGRDPCPLCYPGRKRATPGTAREPR